MLTDSPIIKPKLETSDESSTPNAETLAEFTVKEPKVEPEDRPAERLVEATETDPSVGVYVPSTEVEPFLIESKVIV